MKFVYYWASLFQRIINAWDNVNEGLSFRKIVATFIILIIGYLEVIYTDKNNLREVLVLDMVFSGLLIGLITMQQVIDLKNGRNDNKNLGFEPKENS